MGKTQTYSINTYSALRVRAYRFRLWSHSEDFAESGTVFKLKFILFAY